METLTILINPLMPHLGEELWNLLGHETMLTQTPWPTVDETLLTSDTITIAVQVNGKVRATITLPADANKETAEEIALSDPKIQRAMEGKSMRKFIFVPGKIVNVVAG